MKNLLLEFIDANLKSSQLKKHFKYKQISGAGHYGTKCVIQV